MYAKLSWPRRFARMTRLCQTEEFKTQVQGLHQFSYPFIKSFWKSHFQKDFSPEKSQILIPIPWKSWAWHWQSPDCPSAFPCTTNVVHVCVHWLVYARWRMAHREAFEKWTKEAFLSGKKVGSKIAMRSCCTYFSFALLFLAQPTTDHDSSTPLFFLYKCPCLVKCLQYNDNVVQAIWGLTVLYPNFAHFISTDNLRIVLIWTSHITYMEREREGERERESGGGGRYGKYYKSLITW